MVELELVGLHTDGDHLVLLAPDGQRHKLPIDDALRAAVRRDRPRLEHLRATEESTLRPREIQARIRAGATEADVASESGLPVEAVLRYSGPVTDERAWIASQAQELPIGREPGAPTLGDLVVDRLAARGVEAELTWDAVRRAGEPWEVLVRFAAGDSPREARWSVDLVARTLVALDDEGRWLSETELGQAGPRRHLSAVRARLYDVEADADISSPRISSQHPSLRGRAPLDAVIRDARPRPAASSEDAAPATEASDELPDETVDAPQEQAEPEHPSAATERLLDELDASRGTRQPLDTLPDDHTDDAPTLFDHAPEQDERTSAEPAPAARVVALPTPPPQAADVPDEPAAPARGRHRTKRTSVPSWDEIVFGAKPE
ncbi:DNA-binding protein [Beutenbergia cavernae DSM 12333]|uniref:DNA-binding protein n=1 Tax=Beutenbergia cavernae (strain ATCC BAA-8 / DSM 12333 / CCUG 43141 / JCM 11478 / NBRC 16432 / NCIMB 13614 / HKI 0122) TaxID=471853 RepID=C5C5J8_BEUC1|nr:septation protein SepH [Beutenbergia cavernae]ACQ80189.1 DNA-binding protein [Beutenbergia cavernae DSM 12333]